MDHQDAGRLFSRSELADAFRVTPLRVTKWVADGCPVVDRGARGRESKFNLAAVVDWRITKALQAHGIGSDAVPIDLANERAKLAHAQTAKYERDLRVSNKELLPRAQVIRDDLAFVVAIKAKLLALPRRMAQAGLVTIERQPAIADFIREALEELSRWKTFNDLRAAAKGNA